jgi:hypothetical protein
VIEVISFPWSYFSVQRTAQVPGDFDFVGEVGYEIPQPGCDPLTALDVTFPVNLNPSRFFALELFLNEQSLNAMCRDRQIALQYSLWNHRTNVPFVFRTQAAPPQLTSLTSTALINPGAWVAANTVTDFLPSEHWYSAALFGSVLHRLPLSLPSLMFGFRLIAPKSIADQVKAEIAKKRDASEALRCAASFSQTEEIRLNDLMVALTSGEYTTTVTHQAKAIESTGKTVSVNAPTGSTGSNLDFYPGLPDLDKTALISAQAQLQSLLDRPLYWQDDFNSSLYKLEAQRNGKTYTGFFVSLSQVERYWQRLVSEAFEDANVALPPVAAAINLELRNDLTCEQKDDIEAGGGLFTTSVSKDSGFLLFAPKYLIEHHAYGVEGMVLVSKEDAIRRGSLGLQDPNLSIRSRYCFSEGQYCLDLDSPRMQELLPDSQLFTMLDEALLAVETGVFSLIREFRAIQSEYSYSQLMQFDPYRAISIVSQESEKVLQSSEIASVEIQPAALHEAIENGLVHYAYGLTSESEELGFRLIELSHSKTIRRYRIALGGIAANEGAVCFQQLLERLKATSRLVDPVSGQTYGMSVTRSRELPSHGDLGDRVIGRMCEVEIYWVKDTQSVRVESFRLPDIDLRFGEN